MLLQKPGVSRQFIPSWQPWLYYGQLPLHFDWSRRPGMRFKTCPCRFSAVTTDGTSSVSASGFNDGRVLRHWASVFLSSFWQTRKIKISFHSQWVLHSSLISPRLAKEEALCTYVLIGLNLWWKLRRINRNCQDVGVGGRRKLFKCHRMRL